MRGRVSWDENERGETKKRNENYIYLKMWEKTERLSSNIRDGMTTIKKTKKEKYKKKNVPLLFQ